MIVSVASGKGGTGKTTVALMLALGAGIVQVADGDVEEPNCHLFMNPEIQEVNSVEISIPQIDLKRCNGCGDCAKVCRFAALAVAGGKAMVFPELCHSCGGCVLACKTEAIQEVSRRIGEVRIGVGSGAYSHVRWIGGRIDPGMPASGPIIRAVREELVACECTVIDCPPGTSCSMATAVQGSDVCLLVTEPNAFGLHDLELAIHVLKEIGIVRRGVVVNKSETGEWRRRIQELCLKHEIPVIAEIPYSRKWAAEYAGGILPVEAIDMGRRIWEGVRLAWPLR
ncbi:MAG TPA: 4Fe-4S binding protein [Negativicutes bacterium]|nr:4Fe-4S binding protein [Negativicutes bacterium]